MPFTWSQAALDDLHRLYIQEGLSASETAGVLGGGLTRNAVLGKVQRQGWSKPVPAKAGRPPKSQPSQPDKPRLVRPPLNASRRAGPLRGRVPLPPLREITVISTPRPWEEREDHECAFPVGEPRRPALQLSCCARTAPRRAYCAAHWTLMTLGCPALEPEEQKAVAKIARRAA